jgi:hypothetical protein
VSLETIACIDRLDADRLLTLHQIPNTGTNCSIS